ncbi:MAG TPA: hypothetical protein VG778_07975 [Blastocatellia bacterium]|jgi:hypothetical protein|nr:hypothetical protein [Blastocatellia bacterium]
MVETKPIASTAGRRVDLSPLVGSWSNSYSETKWIERIEISKDGDSFLITTFGVSEPREWGVAQMEGYEDATGELAFIATYDLGSMEATFAGNKAKGLIVIGAYYKLKDGTGRIFNREFYFRED